MENRRSLFLAALLVLAASCSNVWEGEKGALKLNLRMEAVFSSPRAPVSEEGVRTIIPEASWEPTSYSVLLSGPGGTSQTAQTAEGSLEILLAPGDWSVEASALSESGLPVARGSAGCVLKPNASTSLNLSLAPLCGVGSLDLVFSLSIPGYDEGNFTGELKYLGIPGAEPQPTQPDIGFDFPAGSASLSREDLQAGQYALELRYTDAAGEVLSGLADTVLILAGYLTRGQCVVEVETPELRLDVDIVPWEPLDPPCMGAPSYIPAGSPLACLALLSADHPPSAPGGSWYVNGIQAGEATPVETGMFGRYPGGTVAMVDGGCPAGSRMLRIDFIEHKAAERRAGSGTTRAVVADPNSDRRLAWLASYGTKALASKSAFGGLAVLDPCPSYDIKALAASDSGLVAVSGFDAEGSIHLFTAPFTATGPGSAFLRLWKGKIRIDGTYKNADRLAISADGRFLAAASSLSDWLWILGLDEEGRPISEHSFTDDSPGASALGNNRAIAFSGEDGDTRLIVLCSRSESALVFDPHPDTPMLAASIPLDPGDLLGDLGLQDAKGLPSGSVIATAADASAVFILADDLERGWCLLDTIRRADSSDPLYKPGAISVSASLSGFYVLCNKERVLGYRPDNSVSFELETAYALPPEAEGSTALASRLDASGTSEWIALAGGGSNLSCWSSHQPEIIYSLGPNPDLAGMGPGDGIAEAAQLCSKGEDFILGGGKASVISVFGIQEP